MNNFNMDALMAMLSKVDKKDLEEGIKKATELLQNKDKDSTNNNE